MLHDLDATLEALVHAELSVSGVDVSFVGPDDQFPPSGVRLPALSFFLYDIREATELRDTEWTTEFGPDGVGVRRRPPARVTCSYLITAWASDSAPDPAQDEHRLLGAVLTVLLRHRKIPQEYLRGGLVGAEPAMPTRILAENQLHSLGEFWQAMGGRPKASLHYAVTLSVDVFEAAETGPRVAEHRITIEQSVGTG